MKLHFLIIPVIILASCHTRSEKPAGTTKIPKADTNISTNVFIELDSIEARGKRLRDTNYFFLNKLLDSSLKLAYHKGFKDSFLITIDTSVFKFKKMFATISFGNLFSKDHQHLIIKRFINEYDDYQTSLYSDIFLLENNLFKKLTADTIDNGYVDDYFEDANQDGFKDYLVQSYSTAGCCPRTLEVGHIYSHQNGHFNRVEFFNRERDSLGQNFFETSYGLNYYISLYKFKWNGLKPVLLEEIYVTPTKTGAYNPHPASYTRIFYLTGKKQLIKQLPKEYARLRMAEYISPLEK
jgi:hypothetical protein